MNIKTSLKEGKSIYELPLKVCFYARVSTINEIQKSSIINQINYFKNYIKNISNWELVNGYIDEGISGKNVKNRGNFLKMINDAKSNKFNLILTKSVSRFARNTIDSIKYTELLLEHNINNYYTLYMHLQNIYVSTGQTVSSGQVIGTMGNTGNVRPIPINSNSTSGTHLHFCIYIGDPYRGGYAINPMSMY